MIGREVIGEDGRLYVAQEHRIVVEVIEGCVCHGEDAVAFTWRKKFRCQKFREKRKKQGREKGMKLQLPCHDWEKKREKEQLSILISGNKSLCDIWSHGS